MRQTHSWWIDKIFDGFKDEHLVFLKITRREICIKLCAYKSRARQWMSDVKHTRIHKVEPPWALTAQTRRVWCRNQFYISRLNRFISYERHRHHLDCSSLLSRRTRDKFVFEWNNRSHWLSASITYALFCNKIIKTILQWWNRKISFFSIALFYVVRNINVWVNVTNRSSALFQMHCRVVQLEEA